MRGCPGNGDAEEGEPLEPEQKRRDPQGEQTAGQRKSQGGEVAPQKGAQQAAGQKNGERVLS
ncbi:hypothetical protein SDC9_72499 [bioreactor metagenome]|uniref:Uncharacterized protein n=1 Tax=bioreactor metagenome TaxID=1076179 RepID=A0A644YDH3_9ZZZZ